MMFSQKMLLPLKTFRGDRFLKYGLQKDICTPVETDGGKIFKKSFLNCPETVLFQKKQKWSLKAKTKTIIEKSLDSLITD